MWYPHPISADIKMQNPHPYRRIAIGNHTSDTPLVITHKNWINSNSKLVTTINRDCSLRMCNRNCEFI